MTQSTNAQGAEAAVNPTHGFAHLIEGSFMVQRTLEMTVPNVNAPLGA